ncbi:MAG: iron-sulfur cluster assembly scaffold protein, partial [bacterium]|nr:iron-sulfur cluster assembly scaffold protein [bacterium]
MDEELYKENILDHYKHPRNKRKLPAFSMKGEGINANCGDAVALYVRLEGSRAADASFTGEGCAVSQASASLLTEKLRGMALPELRMLAPGDVYTMLGVKISPGRANCALLPYEALQKA